MNLQNQFDSFWGVIVLSFIYQASSEKTHDPRQDSKATAAFIKHPVKKRSGLGLDSW